MQMLQSHCLMPFLRAGALESGSYVAAWTTKAMQALF